jgi:hypothetical protein
VSAAPDVYWHYYFSGLLHAREEKPVRPSIASLPAAIADDEAHM